MKKFVLSIIAGVIFFALGGIANAQSDNIAFLGGASGSVNQGFNKVSPAVGFDADYSKFGLVFSNRFLFSTEHKTVVGNGHVINDTFFVSKPFGTGDFRPTILVGGEIASYNNSQFGKTAFIPIVGAGLNYKDTFIVRAEFLTRTLNVSPKGTGGRLTGEYFLPVYKNFGVKADAQVGFLRYTGRTGRNYSAGAGIYFSF